MTYHAVAADSVSRALHLFIVIGFDRDLVIYQIPRGPTGGCLVKDVISVVEVFPSVLKVTATTGDFSGDINKFTLLVDRIYHLRI